MRSTHPRFKQFALAPVLVLLVAGCGSRTEPTAAEPKAEGASAKLVDVNNSTGVELDRESVKLAGISVVKVGSDDVSALTQPTGEISPTDAGTIQVTSRLPGKITEAGVGVGDRVRKGEIIAEVDSVDLAAAEAAFQTAVSHESLAKNQLAQQKKLAGYGSLSEQAVEDARKASVASDAAVGGDEAQIRVDRLALTNTQELVSLGEITAKPEEDALNAYAQTEAAASQADTTLHSTKANLDRAQLLYNGGIYSKQQLEDAVTAYDSAKAATTQAKVAERLAKQELSRQHTVFTKNLNGASSLQGAQSKLQQDQHTYQNDLVAQELAHRQFVRAKIVRKSGIPISQALQTAQDAYDSAVIAEQGAANALGLYGVRPQEALSELKDGRVVVPVISPIEGIVAARSMAVGLNVDTTTPLVRLVNLDTVYVDAQIYEKDIQGVSVGDPVKIHVSALPGRTFNGTVHFVANEVSSDTRTVLVRTILRNPGWVLRPGMFATASIGGKGFSHGLSVPADSVLQEGDKQVVYVQVSPGEYVKRTIRAGSSVGGKIPVQSGLEMGDQVVVGGNVYIQKAQEQLENGKNNA